MKRRFAALRAVALTIGKEFRLLWRDQVGLFMLLAAPIVVIAAAGFSLADVYGGGSRNQSDQIIVMVDEDHGQVGRAVATALANHRGLRVLAADRKRAHELVVVRRSALLGVIVAAGSTAAIEQGRDAHLLIVIDPVRYQQAVRVEVELAELCRRITAQAAAQAQTHLFARRAELAVRIDRAVAALQTAHEQAVELSRAAATARDEAQVRLKAQIAATIAEVGAQMRKAFADSLDRTLSGVAAKINEETSRQRDAQTRLRLYFAQLDAARVEFERWFTQLKALAGSKSSQIPAPPDFPLPPPDLMALLRSPAPAPIDAAALREQIAAKMNASTPPAVAMPSLPPLPGLGELPPMPQLSHADLNGTLRLPGSLGMRDLPAEGASAASLRGFNVFDLEVPGFAVTFLLIGTLMGLSLALIDEHDWGTLTRLRATTAPLGATLLGKLLARFLIGFAQLIILFAASWAIFGMSLGRTPAALLLPCAAIAFVAAAFGLMVGGAGRTRDAVLPIGAIVIMTMAAMGGCWWPIDFEPAWMRTVALALPTTWAMRAFNDLMIRELPASTTLVPSAVNLGFGILYAAVGVAIARRRFA